MMCKDVGQLLLNMEFYVLSVFGNDARVSLAKSSKKDKWLTIKILIDCFVLSEEHIMNKINFLEQEFIYDNDYHPKEALDKVDIRYIFVGDRNGRLQNKIR